MEFSLQGDRKHTLSEDDFLDMSKEELVKVALRLQAHNIQLKNIVKKRGNDSTNPEKQQALKRKFDFSKCHKRHILLRILYLGWDYQGYAAQEDSEATIEHHLFAALTKACLIECRQTSNYNRCGRTDKGVSSFGQVISIDVRSSLPSDYSMSTDAENELKYCKILNRLLPDDIRAVAWCPAAPGFSARFDCCQRTYKYYFPKGNLNIDAMREGSQWLVGTHDFRNLCKMDVANGVVNYIREIISIDIQPWKEPGANSDSKYSMMVLTLVGSAFLWHQVRCIVAVLVLIGQGCEEPGVIQQLLDVEQNPRKPQYSLASEVPLNLFHCQYPFGDEQWLINEEVLAEVEYSLLKVWTFTATKYCVTHFAMRKISLLQSHLKTNKTTEIIKLHLLSKLTVFYIPHVLHMNAKLASMIRNILSEISALKKTECDGYEQNNCLLQGVKSKVYKPLMSRQTCESLESRMDHYSKKRKHSVLESKVSEAELSHNT